MASSGLSGESAIAALRTGLGPWGIAASMVGYSIGLLKQGGILDQYSRAKTLTNWHSDMLAELNAAYGREIIGINAAYQNEMAKISLTNPSGLLYQME